MPNKWTFKVKPIRENVGCKMDDDAYIAGYEIGIDAGRREVLGWMLMTMAFTNSENLPPNILRVDFKYDEWKAKLAEWGIE